MKLREHGGIILLITIFLIIKLFFVFKPYLIGWDESVYIGMGKYIYSAGTIGLWEDIRPPGLSFLIGLGWRVGFNPIAFGLALELLFSAGCLWLVYTITKELSSTNAGLIATLILGITPIFFEMSSQILTSIPAAFFILLGIWLALKNKHPFLIGVVVGIAFLMRFPAVLIGFPVVLYIMSRSRKEKNVRTTIKKALSNIVSFVGGGFLVNLPFLIFNYIAYRPDTSNSMEALLRPILLGSLHQANSIHAASTNILYYMTNLVSQNPLLLFFIIGLVLLAKRRKSSLLITLPLILFWAYFTIIVNKQVRFALLFVPLMAILAGVGISYMIALVKKIKFSNTSLAVFALLLCALFLVPLQENKQTYEWLIDEPHPLESLYKAPLQGPVITTLPMPVAYADTLFIPAYDNLDIALYEYEKNKPNAAGVVWFSEFFPCSDELCQQKKDLLHARMREDFEASAYFSHHEAEYTIFN